MLSKHRKRLGAKKMGAQRRGPRTAGRTVAGVPVTMGDLFGSMKGATTIEGYCPFCDSMGEVAQKGWLMVCKRCGRRID